MGIFLSTKIHIEYLLYILFLATLSIIIKTIISFRVETLLLLVMTFYILVGIIRLSVFNDISYNPISEFINEPIEFICTVIEQPKIQENKATYIVRLNNIMRAGSKFSLDSKVMLTIYDSKSLRVFSYGDILRVNGVLSIPTDAFNEGGFDYSSYLKTKGVYVSTFVLPNQVEQLKEGGSVGIIQDFVFCIRKFILDSNKKYLPLEEGALLSGIVLGERSDFTDKMDEDFLRTGLSHIVAVSGMHVAIFLLGIAYFFGFLGVGKVIQKFFSIFAIILFILITGASPSVIRAGVMAIIFLLSYTLSREKDALTSLFAAGLVVLVYNPVFLFHAGFQLSFLATFALIIFHPIINKKLERIPSFLRGIVTASVSAQIGTLPIAAIHFNGISLVSVVSNILIVPLIFPSLMTGIILYLAILISPFLGFIVSGIVFIPLKIILLLSRLFSSIPFALLKVPSPDISILIIYLLITYLLYNILIENKKSKTIKYVSIFLSIFIMFVFCFQLLQSNLLEITFINVGQGDATLFQVPGGISVLVDSGGSASGSSFDVGENIIMPFLLYNGIMSIDMAIVSHYHNDHAEGFLYIMDNMHVSNLLLPLRVENSLSKEELIIKQELIKVAEKNNVSIHYISKGDSIRLSASALMEVLSPDEHIISSNIYDENDRSLLIKFCYGDLNFLFTGDIEKDAEEYIVSSGVTLDADVIKISHHGSGTSTTDEFLDAVNPDYAIISVGKNNYGHPSGEVLEGLYNRNVELFLTDESGNVDFITCRKRIRKIKVFKEGVVN
jgi:competence protein ComEC